MSQLHVIVYIEIESSALPDFVVTASTWASGTNTMLLNFANGSYTSLNITNPDNDLHNNVCVNVASTQHAPPHVAIQTATFNEAIADECIKGFRHQKVAGKHKYSPDINSVAFLDADQQGCAWYVRVALNTLQVKDQIMSAMVKGRTLSVRSSA
jgi:hypothetical protein